MSLIIYINNNLPKLVWEAVGCPNPWVAEDVCPNRLVFCWGCPPNKGVGWAPKVDVDPNVFVAGIFPNVDWPKGVVFVGWPKPSKITKKY